MFSWQADHDAKLLEYREQEFTNSETAQALNFWFESDAFTKDMVQKRYHVLAPPMRLELPPEPMPIFRAYFDEDGQPRKTPAKAPLRPYLERLRYKDGRSEILHMSDFHVDQHDEELVDLVFQRHCAADLLVLAGDFLDIYAYSRFDKLKNRPIEGEIENGMRILTHAADRYPHIVVLRSNHLDRVAKTMHVPTGLGFLMEPDLMKHLALPFANVHVLDDWYFQIGDAIFAHADYANGFAPKSAQKVHEYLIGRLATRQLDLEPWSVLVQAHTHAVGSLMHGGVKLIESGCLAKLPLEYTTTAQSVRFARPQANGYAVVTQRAGRSLVNESREYFLASHGARKAAA